MKIWMSSVALLVLLAFASSGFAQTSFLSGKVTRDNGDPMTGAEVVLEELKRSVRAGEDGSYRFDGVPPGRYHVSVRAEGYSTRRTEVTVPAEGATLDLVVELDLHFAEVVSVSPNARAQFESYQPTSVLAGQDLQKQLEATIGATLQSEPGVAMRALGPGPARPVIRGLDGDRVAVLQDGQRVGDLSSQSGDHGVTINPSSAKRIEVVRGPATLLYGSNAIGGLVNVITDQIPTRSVRGSSGDFTLDFGANAAEAGGSGDVHVGAALAAFALSATPTASHAQTPADQAALRQDIEQLRKEFDALKEQYGNRLSALEAKLADVAGGQVTAPAAPPEPTPQPTAVVPPGAEGAGGPSGALPIYGGGAAASKIFNPDIAVIGDFLGAAGKNAVNPQPALEMHESEASFQAIVDPYARADFFVAFGQEGVELEEGFITFPTLPGGFLAKVGKLRAAFGKVNTLHNHVLPWTDRPLATNNLLGGEEGLGDAGFSVARLIPAPFFLEATGQVFRGDSSDVFLSSKRGNLSYVGHVRGYQDITESSNIDLGFSYAHGHNASGFEVGLDESPFKTKLYGVDATFRWRPLRRSIYRSFVGRSEVFWSRREQPDALQKAVGYYLSGDYQFGRRWFAGARSDRSDRANAASLFDTGQSLLLTYWPSEFSQLRSQYRRTKYADGPTAHEFLFQFLFSIGAHGAHPF